jgi:hypothetical protein
MLSCCSKRKSTNESKLLNASEVPWSGDDALSFEFKADVFEGSVSCATDDTLMDACDGIKHSASFDRSIKAKRCWIGWSCQAMMMRRRSA